MSVSVFVKPVLRPSTIPSKRDLHTFSFVCVRLDGLEIVMVERDAVVKAQKAWKSD